MATLMSFAPDTFLLAPHMHVHIVGIGGSGMSAIAQVLLGQGYPVSGSDMQANALTAALQAAGETIELLRVRAAPRRNLAAPNSGARLDQAPGHLSLVIIPAAGEPFPQPSAELCRQVWAFLDARRLLTVRHHVVGPVYVAVQLELTIFLRSDAPPAETLRQVYATLAAFFDPISGGPDGTGWPFGRDIFVSEIHAELEKLPLIDFVEAVRISAPDHPERLIQDGDAVIGLELDVHELAEVRVAELIAHTSDGGSYDLDIVGMIEQWRLG